MTHDGTKVYFYGTNDESLIKIGKTDGPILKRRKSLENEVSLWPNFNGLPLHLLALVDGVRSDEQAVHKYFDDARYRREWFNASVPLLDYIRWLRNQWFVSTSEDAEPLGTVSSCQWLPGNGRSVAMNGEPRQLEMFCDSSVWNCFPTPEITGDDFYTNKAITQAVRSVLGEIDLDPASHPVANKEVRATTIFTSADSGLTRAWFGRVWLNPPFSQWSHWVRKLSEEWLTGNVSEMCVLVATRTLTARYFSPVLSLCSAMCVLAGRFPFWGPKATSSPDDGHAVFYFGGNATLFESVFSELGNVLFRKAQAS